MRADQWLMLGVVAVGAYAVYRIVQKPSTPSNGARPLPGPVKPLVVLPPPTNIPTGALPPLPTIPAPPAGSAVVDGPNLSLTPNRWYGGRIETMTPRGPSPSPFSPNADAGTIAAGLERLSFRGSTVRPDAPEAVWSPPNVQVFMTPAQARGRVPDYALAGAGQGTRWFYARWAGESPAAIPRPSWLPLLWISSPPSRPATVGRRLRPLLDQGLRHG